MHYILAFAVCSAITGFCNNTTVHPLKFDKWSDCVIAGSQLTIEFTKRQEVKINKDKLYITYFCNENNSDKTPT